MMSVDAPHVSPLEMLQDISRFAAGPQRDLLPDVSDHADGPDASEYKSRK